MNSKLRTLIPMYEIEQGAQQQIYNALKIDALKLMAVMPDVHQGYSIPIGSVVLLDDLVWPEAVGYDLNCGMCHYNTGLDAMSFLGNYKEREHIAQVLSERIPVGSERHTSPIASFRQFYNAAGDKVLAKKIKEGYTHQLGTLGSGNHFVELGINEKGELGITIHSGSRNAGWSIGDYYIKKANGVISVNSDLGKAYLIDLEWSEEYAFLNRLHMLLSVCSVLDINISTRDMTNKLINETHNHAEVTPEGVLHRKGATQAAEGQLGIIPANMRDGVYVTRGLGNSYFLNSASHGAGRVLSRKGAKKKLDKAIFKEQMKGIVAPKSDNFIDEAPDAYKKIEDVLQRQEGVVVDIVDHFKPLIVLKG